MLLMCLFGPLKAAARLAGVPLQGVALMTAAKNEIERDAILSAFLKECPNPSPEQIAQWRNLHPDYSAEILELAADLVELSIERGADVVPDPTDEELAIARREFEKTLRQLERRKKED
jgi:hypothetical protein